MLDRTDQILQCVFNLHAFSIPAASLSMFQWRMHYFWTVVSEVGISAILMCREFKLGTLNSCPITIIFSPKYIQGNSLFFMLLGWKNNVSVLLFLSFSGLWVRCFKMETCDIYKRILGNFSTKKIKQRNPQTKQNKNLSLYLLQWPSYFWIWSFKACTNSYFLNFKIKF